MGQASAGGLALAADEPAAAGAGKIASLQNQVETRRRGAEGWEPSTLYQVLQGLDRVRTGAASRAAILYADRTLHRINEKSEVEIQPPAAGQPGLLKVVSGTHYFSSRSPKDYGRIETPTVTAAIRGTEFVIEVAADLSTTITMLEGVVEASNELGSLQIGPGEQAFVEPGKPPVRRILIRPRDAVAWALAYPPVLGGRDAQRLEGLGAEGRDLASAAGMLAAGQVEPARELIEAARSRSPREPIALALASVIEVAANRKEEALRLAEEAAAADPNSAAAALAVSYAAQAHFDIGRARAMAERAAQLDPTSALSLARAAELRMAEGDLQGAEEAAGGAVQRDPGEARALAVQGFAALARLRTDAAGGRFESAVAVDPAQPLARLGLGLVKIRRGDLLEGREELQIATALDPDDALLRAYLGKALYEERLAAEAGRELDASKRLDPLDPTPFLYDAIRKQNENRPVEALADLRASIARNDNRAVYRSRMLLDQDRAVRGSDQARIYNDLGFEQLGLVTARRSADENQANYSSHLFLAGNYRNLPGFAPAFLSEVLQARIYQPVSVNAARPDVVNESVSFNEYTALFDRPRARLFAGGAYGKTDTGLEELFGRNRFLLDALSLDRSRVRTGEVTGTLNGDRFAAAVSYRRLDDDGFRFNNDREAAAYRGFLQWAPTHRDSFQVNLQVGRQETGDIPLRFVPAIFAQERLQTRLVTVGVGYHRFFSPRADLAVSVIYNETEQTGRPFFCTFAGSSCSPLFPDVKATATLEGPQAEVQQVLRWRRMTWVLGAGAFRGEVRAEATGAERLEADDEFTNAYAYGTLRFFAPLEITAGLAAERVVSPTGMLTPRDAQIGLAELVFEESRFSPKLGVSAYLPTRTSLRAAASARLAPAVGRIQTLEPTQVAGFNQFFFEPGGTRSRAYGFGVDQEFGDRFFGGASVLRRRLDVPEASCENPDDFSRCGFQTASRIDIRESVERHASGYFNAVLTNRLVFALEYVYLEREFDLTQVNNNALFADRSETSRWKPGLRLFLPWGLFAGVSATRFAQEVDQFDDFSSPERSVASDAFWITDARLGYRLPKRLGSIVLEGRNLGDREFLFFDRAVEDTFLPARTVTLAVNFTY